MFRTYRKSYFRYWMYMIVCGDKYLLAPARSKHRSERSLSLADGGREGVDGLTCLELHVRWIGTTNSDPLRLCPPHLCVTFPHFAISGLVWLRSLSQEVACIYTAWV